MAFGVFFIKYVLGGEGRGGQNAKGFIQKGVARAGDLNVVGLKEQRC